MFFLGISLAPADETITLEAILRSLKFDPEAAADLSATEEATIEPETGR